MLDNALIKHGPPFEKLMQGKEVRFSGKKEGDCDVPVSVECRGSGLHLKFE
jgi:hypothetical protein